MTCEQPIIQEDILGHLDMMYSVAMCLVKQEEKAKTLVEQAVLTTISRNRNRDLPIKTCLLRDLRETYKLCL